MKGKLRTAVLALMAGFITLNFQTQPAMQNITDLLEHEVARSKTPSVQYSFFDLDSAIYQYRKGYSNISTGKMVNEKTVYNLFSLTKTFTALGVLQLAESGKIDLCKPVRHYLPAFSYSNDITVEQLLNHSSGIPNPLPLRWIHLEKEHPGFQRDSFFSQVFNDHPDLKSLPGTKFRYSNLGYVILGQLIEAVSGISYEAYIQENIVARSATDSTNLGFQFYNAAHAKGYQKSLSFTNFLLGFMIDKRKFMGPKEGAWKPFNYFYINGTSYGGLMGTIRGLTAYGQALLKSSSPLLGDSLKRKLFTETIIHGKPTGMSYSWYTGNLKGNNYLAHAGGGGGYYAELRLYPELGVGSVIVFNRTGLSDERFLDKTDAFFIPHKPAH